MKRSDRILSTQKTVRPTTGKVREALFNIVRERIAGARFLDLYAGTGVVGMEALKEGAAEVVFVEASTKGAKAISAALTKKGLHERAQVAGQKAVSYIERAGASQLSFDIIFLDPPYHSDEILIVLSAIDSTPVLKEDGLVVAEHFAKRVLPDELRNLRKVKAYKYGDTVLSLYEM